MPQAGTSRQISISAAHVQDLCKLVPIDALYRFSKTSEEHIGTAGRVLYARWRQAFSGILEWETFINVIDTTSSIFSGPFVLDVMYPQYRPITTLSHPILIFTTRSNFLRVINHLQELEDALTSWDVVVDALPPCGYQETAEIITPYAHFQIVRSRTDSAISPVLYYPSTHLMNVITAKALISLYPNLTFQHQSVLRGGIDATAVSTGIPFFNFFPQLLSPPAHSLCSLSAHCSLVARHFLDKFTATFSFTDEPFTWLEPLVAWTLGSNACNCAGASNHTVACV